MLAATVDATTAIVMKPHSENVDDGDDPPGCGLGQIRVLPRSKGEQGTR